MKEVVISWCKEHGVSLKERTPYHASLTRDNSRLDLFWVNKRYHVVKFINDASINNTRGDIPEDVRILLETIFI